MGLRLRGLVEALIAETEEGTATVRVSVVRPASRVETERVAIPEPLRVAVPREVVPSRKVTLPVETVPEEVTVAVRVMLDCTNTGFPLEESVTVGLCLS